MANGLIFSITTEKDPSIGWQLGKLQLAGILRYSANLLRRGMQAAGGHGEEDFFSSNYENVKFFNQKNSHLPIA